MSEIEHVHVSQLSVERFLQGELKPDEKRGFDGAVARCETCARRLAETEADDRAFALRPVPDYVREPAAEGPVRGLEGHERWFRGWFVAIPAAAAALVAVLLWPALQGERLPGIGSRGADDAVRLKGTDGGAEVTPLSLGFYVSRGGDRSVGRPGEELTAGDRIQFWYDAAEAKAFALVGVDGRGAVTAYFSSSGSGGRVLERGRGLTLGAAVELDDARGAERFFLCAGPNAGDLAAVERAAKSLAESRADLSRVERLPFACDQASVWIRKE
jgi:hypothetical protein